MAVVHGEAWSARDRLGELGLSLEKIEESLRRAQAERNFCTRFDPVALPGNIFWGRTVRFLREAYVPQGWRSISPNNVPLLMAPTGDFALTASSGSRETGYAALTPSTRYPKGPAVAQRVETNRQLLLFPNEAGQLEGEHDLGDGIPTWFLLYQHVRTEQGTRLYAEVSMPNERGDRGKIDTWYERIILPWFDVDDTIDFNDEDDGDDGIDIPVERLS